MSDPSRYVVVAGNLVANLVMWDGVSPWSPPEGTEAFSYPSGDISPGWSWNDGSPTPPPPTPEAGESADEKARALDLRRADELAATGTTQNLLASIVTRLKVLTGG